MSTTIPHTLLQTNKQREPPHVLEQIRLFFPGWTYAHFTDPECLQFFHDNPIPELPEVSGKFREFTRGAHKADLFRYYYLYLHGGVFMDSDAMVHVPIHEILRDHSCVFVDSWPRPQIFNGFIAVPKNHPVIHEALAHVCKTTQVELQEDYFHFTHELYRIVHRFQDPGMKVYSIDDNQASLRDPLTHQPLFTHYYNLKIIPLLESQKTPSSPSPNLNIYQNEAHMSSQVSIGHHRGVIGGLWDELGSLQLNFLVQHGGMTPSSYVLDIGCGCLRAGVKLIEVLHPDHYYGMDISQSLLDAGYEVELKALGLTPKLSRGHLICDGGFDFARRLGDQTFDLAIAQSVFTHLPVGYLRTCLERLGCRMKVGGVFYATFFLVPEGRDKREPLEHHPGGVVSFGDIDPFHYGFQEIHEACQGLPWGVQLVGHWGHPRDQRMVQFTWRGV